MLLPASSVGSKFSHYYISQKSRAGIKPFFEGANFEG